MYTFKLFNIDGDLENSVDFDSFPERWAIENLIWYVDTKREKKSIDIIMQATGEDVFFSTEGAEEDSSLFDGIYVSLEQIN